MAREGPLALVGGTVELVPPRGEEPVAMVVGGHRGALSPREGVVDLKFDH